MAEAMFFLSKHPGVISVYVGLLAIVMFRNFPQELAEMISDFGKKKLK